MIKVDEVRFLGKEIDLFEYKKELLFSAQQIGVLLEYSTSNISKMVSNVDEEEIRKIFVESKNNTSNDNRKKKQIFLTEDGLHELLFQSKKPIAKEFKKEVKKVLKLIKQNGYYIATEKDDKWMGVRKEGIRTRKKFTDEIEEFVHYAVQGGSKNSKMYYKHLTNLVRKKVGIPNGVERDELNQDKLLELQGYETIVSIKLHRLTELKNMDYHDIYKEIKKMIDEI